MRWSDISWNPSDRVIRQFAGIGMGVELTISARFFWNGDLFTACIVAVPLTFIAICGIVYPALIRPLYVAWMVAVFPIGWTVSRLLMGSIYYLVLTPLGLAMRFSGRDPLQHNFEPARDSYWEPRETTIPLDQFFKQF